MAAAPAGTLLLLQLLAAATPRARSAVCTGACTVPQEEQVQYIPAVQQGLLPVAAAAQTSIPSSFEQQF
jgi:hypothetical protein